MVSVILWGGLRSHAEGRTELTVDAATIQELVRQLGAEYPALTDHLEDRVSFAVNGQIYRDSWFVPLPENAEVVVLPRLAGG